MEFFFDYSWSFFTEVDLDSLVVSVLGLLETGVVLEESSLIVVRFEVKCISIAEGLVPCFCALTDVLDRAAAAFGELRGDFMLVLVRFP